MLELLTLGILAVVVLAKIFTVKHTQKLTHEKIALDQVVNNLGATTSFSKLLEVER